MKKTLLTMLIISTIFTASLFSKSAQVQLTNTITPINFEYDLYYINELIESDSTEIIEVSSITEDGNTNNFKILASGNQNSDKAVTVTITPDNFKTKLNGSESYNYTSNVLPEVIKDQDIVEILEPGLHSNEKVFGFYLRWSGNSELPAGDYVSDINIEYKIK